MLSISNYVSVFLVVSFPLAFLPITYTHFSSPPFVPHVPPTSSSSNETDTLSKCNIILIEIKNTSMKELLAGE
jgi:hypothetical protein